MSGLEVIDVATHKVLNHFVLNTPTKRYRFNGVADKGEPSWFCRAIKKGLRPPNRRIGLNLKRRVLRK